MHDDEWGDDSNQACPECGQVSWAWTPDDRLECTLCGHIEDESATR